MIAPIRPTETEPLGSRRSLLRARMAVAESLLPARRATPAGPALSAWKAWLWTTWIAVIGMLYIADLFATWWREL